MPEGRQPYLVIAPLPSLRMGRLGVWPRKFQTSRRSPPKTGQSKHLTPPSLPSASGMGTTEGLKRFSSSLSWLKRISSPCRSSSKTLPTSGRIVESTPQGNCGQVPTPMQLRVTFLLGRQATIMLPRAELKVPHDEPKPRQPVPAPRRKTALLCCGSGGVPTSLLHTLVHNCALAHCTYARLTYAVANEAPTCLPGTTMPSSTPCRILPIRLCQSNIKLTGLALSVRAPSCGTCITFKHLPKLGGLQFPCKLQKSSKRAPPQFLPYEPIGPWPKLPMSGSFLAHLLPAGAAIPGCRCNAKGETAPPASASLWWA